MVVGGEEDRETGNGQFSGCKKELADLGHRGRGEERSENRPHGRHNRAAAVLAAIATKAATRL